MTNRPDFKTTYLLNPDEPCVEIIEKDTDGVTIRLPKEDHTLGNLIATKLRRDPLVIFAAYKVPHPLKPEVILRLSVKPGHDSVEVFKTALTSLMSDLESLSVPVINDHETSDKTVVDEVAAAGTAVAGNSWADDLPEEDWLENGAAD